MNEYSLVTESSKMLLSNNKMVKDILNERIPLFGVVVKVLA